MQSPMQQTTAAPLNTKSVIKITYQDLLNQTPEAIACAKRAFCTRSSYGALQISNIPDWKSCRDQVMKHGMTLALDPEEEGKKMRDECRGDVRVGPGWMGTPGEETHSLQSGFYANMRNQKGLLLADDSCNEGNVKVWDDNRWPSERLKKNESNLVDDSGDEEATFEESMTSAAALMYNVTLLTLDLAQKAAVEVIDRHGENASDSKKTSSSLPHLRTMAEQSEFLPARLVYYDAGFSREDKLMKNDGRHYWLPWHVDFNLATAFAPAAWVDEAAALKGCSEGTFPYLCNRNLEHDAGLLLRNPEGSIIPAAIGDDSILVQLGANAQLASGGILRAGPHAVGKIDGYEEGSTRVLDKFGRLSFGLFVYGPWTARMKPSDELLEVLDETDSAASVLKDDFGCLMEKAYTGDTVLESYKKFEKYMNGE